MSDTQAHVGFISTRLAGTDGVSLEAQKWCNTLGALGLECFYFAGECDTPAERTLVVPEAHFTHPEILALTSELFSGPRRTPQATETVERLRRHLKAHLVRFIETFDIEVLLVENALSLPVNIPLGLALTEVIAETALPTIAHHHDFTWERKRFSITAAGDYLRTAFPPNLPSVRHVVINSFAARQLALRTGASAILIPNVMDFDSPPPDVGDGPRRLRQALNIPEPHRVLLQPTRVVPRKRIELALELARRLGQPCSLVISHTSGDEGNAYQDYLRSFADLINVTAIFGGDRIGPERGTLPDGSPSFSLADAYAMAELVTYPSTVEGFGNAFLETIYHRRPIVMSTYEIFRTDIQPKGFRVIGFEDFITDETVFLARQVLDNPALAAAIAEQNYELGRRFYSYRTLEHRLSLLLQDILGAEPGASAFSSS
jgi:glycosyltransferase involved in cell wall biosynthesis